MLFAGDSAVRCIYNISLAPATYTYRTYPYPCTRRATQADYEHASILVAMLAAVPTPTSSASCPSRAAGDASIATITPANLAVGTPKLPTLLCGQPRRAQPN